MQINVFPIDLYNVCTKLFNILPISAFLVLPFCFFSLLPDFPKSLMAREVHRLSTVHRNTLLSNFTQKRQIPLLRGYKIYKLK